LDGENGGEQQRKVFEGETLYEIYNRTLQEDLAISWYEPKKQSGLGVGF